MPRSRRSRTTYRMVVCAVFCAMAVAILALGMLIEIMDITTAAMASLIFLPILLCYGNGYALTSWGVTSLLAIILMPQSIAPWMFFCLLGYYPVLRRQIVRLPRLLALLCKLLLITAAVFLYLLMYWLVFLQGAGSFSETFLLGFGEAGAAPWMAWAVLILSYICFFAFDLLIDRIIILYRYKWQKRVEKILNK